MTRKEYIKIAAILRAAHEQYTDHAPIIFIECGLIDMFTADNPRFDAQRFRAACRVVAS